MNQENSTTGDHPGKRRWLAPAVIAVIAIAAHLAAPRIADEDGTLQAVIVLLTWSAALSALLIWWLFFSGLRWAVRLAGIACLIAACIGFGMLTTFEGFTGGFMPQFRFRFAQSSEDRAIEYFTAENTKASTSDITDSASFPIADTDWPKFGGPNGDQIASNESIRTDWQTNPPKPLWRHPVGAGWSSFAVVGELAFTQEQRGEKECVVCYAVDTGKQVWVHEDEQRFEEPAGGPGPRATPTVHDSRLYTLGATGVLNCLNPLNGEAFWSVNVVSDNGGNLIEWAASGSPVIHEDLVLVNPGTDSAFLAAYDRLTGDKRWLAPKARAGYATPVVAEIDGQPQIIMIRAHGVGGYSADDGRELWFFEWVNNTKINVAQPLVLPDESVFISIGYGGGSARLDVVRDNDSWKVTSRWERPNTFKLKFNGGIYRDGYIYGLDEGILACFDVAEGRRTWKKGRFGYGQILMVDDRLLVLTERGDCVLVEATPETMTELVRFPAIEGKTWNHPVVHRGRLLVRNGSEAACYDLRPQN